MQSHCFWLFLYHFQALSTDSWDGWLYTGALIAWDVMPAIPMPLLVQVRNTRFMLHSLWRDSIKIIMCNKFSLRKHLRWPKWWEKWGYHWSLSMQKCVYFRILKQLHWLRIIYSVTPLTSLHAGQTFQPRYSWPVLLLIYPCMSCCKWTA